MGEFWKRHRGLILTGASMILTAIGGFLDSKKASEEMKEEVAKQVAKALKDMKED